MILPVYLYGQPVLRQATEEIDASYPNLDELIKNMFETMYNADGVGLAAPQIGLPIRVIVIDLDSIGEENKEFKGVKLILINPKITELSGNDISHEEGCLSLPGIHEKVIRKDTVTISYLDEKFEQHNITYTGFLARVIQHEYDHIEQHVFIDHITPIRKQLIKSKIAKILKGIVSCNYRIKAVGAR